MSLNIRRILVLGVDGFSHSDSEFAVKCVPWSRVGPSVNIADYHDIVISSPRSRDAAPRASAYRETLKSSVAFKHLHHGGRIFVVGDPRLALTEKTTRRVGAVDFPVTNVTEFLDWTCLKIDWNDAHGDVVEIQHRGPEGFLAPYLERIRSWNYSMRSLAWDSSRGAPVLREMSEGGSGGVTAFRVALCTNRVGELLASGVDYHYSPNSRPLQLWDGLYFLPEIGLSEHETVQLLLRDVLGVDVACPEPEWVDSIVAPGQEIVDAKIRSTEAAIEAAKADLDKFRHDRTRLREPLRLLYDKGVTLQEPVWAVLEQLGGTIERPREEGNEDGWLTKDLQGTTLECVLEIKGTARSQHDEEGQKQLHRWIERGVRNRGKKYKGLFIGNSSVESELANRRYPFGDQWIKNAKLFELVALRAEELYEAYVANSTGRFDTVGFWSALATTVGPLELTGFIVSG